MSDYEISLQIGSRTINVTLDVTSSFKDISEFLIEEGLIQPHVQVAYYGENSKKLSEDQTQVLSTIICIQNDTVKVLTGAEIQQFKAQLSQNKGQSSGTLTSQQPQQTQQTQQPQQPQNQQVKQQQQQQQQQQQIKNSNNTPTGQSQKIQLNISVEDGSQNAKFTISINPQQILNDVEGAILQHRGIYLQNVAQVDLYIFGQPYNSVDKRQKTLEQLMIKDQATINAKVRWSGGSYC